MAITCSRCGQKQGMMAVLTVDLTDGAYLCESCKAKEAQEKEREATQKAEQLAERLAQLREQAKSVVLTTTHNIDGHRVVKYLGIESVEFVIGTGLFSELSTGFDDMLGQRSSAFETKLQGAKKIAFETLTFRAAQKGANAIVGIDVDYTEFSGNRVGLIVNGTLVQIERAP